MSIDNLPINHALLSQAKAMPGINMDRIDETAREFEAMFMSEMMKPMFESVPVNSQFGGGKGEEIFRSFLREEYGKNLAENGGLGIADLVRQQLIEIQSKSIKPELAQNMQGSDTGVTGTKGETKDVL